MLNDILENIKTLKKSFYHKIIILFCVYLYLNYIFDRINHEELNSTFHKKKFRLVLSLILFLTSQWVYKNVIKKYVYPKY